MSRNKYWSRRFVPWLAVLAGLLLFVFVMAVLADVTSVNIISPTGADPAYTKPGITFTVRYEATGSANADVNIYLSATKVYSENIQLPVLPRDVNPVVPLGFTDGPYTLTVEVIGAGPSTKVMSKTSAVILDQVPPTATIDAIDACVATLVLTTTGTAEDASSGVDKVYAKIQNSDGDWWNGIWQATETWNLATGKTTWSYAAPTLVNAKTYTVTAKSKDMAGTETISVSQPTRTFTVDLSAPTVVITPTLPAWKNSPFNLTGTVSDTGCADLGTGLANAQVWVYNVTGNRYWNGAQWVATSAWNDYADDVSTVASWTYTMPTLTSGRTYQVKAKGTDSVGNFAESATSTFQYDDVNPTAGITAPVTGTYYNAAPTPFTGTASDDYSGVNKVQLTLQRTDGNYWTGSAWGAETWLTATDTTSWFYTDVITWTDTTAYTLTAKATDNAGNDPTSPSVTFYYDTVTPTATITDIGPTEGCAFALIEGTAADDFAGVVNVYVQIDAGDWMTATTWSDPNWTLDVSSFPFEDGVSYDVRAKAVDDAGNETAAGAQPTDTFTYDECPTVAFTAPAEGAILSDLDEFTGTAADAGTGSVQDVHVQINTLGYNAATDTSGGNWSPWEYLYTFDVDGEYTLSAKAQDDFFQWSDVVTRTFKIDTTPPTVTINTINDNTQPTQFSGLVTDTVAGPDWVKIAITNTSGLCWTGTTWGAETWLTATLGSPWSYNASGVTFQGGQTYTVTAKAQDKAGNVGTSAQAFMYGSSQGIPLGAGWNLMSLPLIPNDTAIASVMDGVDVDSVNGYDQEWGGDGWRRWDPPLFTEQLTTMTTDPGYWVKMFSADTLTNAGLFQPNPPGLPKSYSLQGGWNLIGYHATTQARLTGPVTVTTYLGTTLLDNARAMYYYEGGVYKIAASGEAMKVGFGYWLALDAAGTLYP